MKKVYIVIAYRNGNRQNHSYTVACFDKKEEAIKCAELHSDYRGGKYICAVESCVLNSFNNDAEDYTEDEYKTSFNNPITTH